MKNIPIDASVECADGPAGLCTTVIVDPTTLQVTHLVVKEKKPPHTDHLVPVDQVVETTPDLIRLACTTADLSEMAQYTVTDYRQVDIPKTSGAWAGAARSDWVRTVPVKRERIPRGELPLRRGAEAEATDGRVGQVVDLLLDPTTEQITHLVVREQHLWGSKDVILPVSVVDRVVKDTVYLTLDTETISAMLAVPAKWRAEAAEMELVVLASNQAETANQALQALKDLIKQDALEILNAAVLVKDQDGTTSLLDTEDIEPKRGTLFGAIAGGLVGLLGGPAGVVIGAAAGAAAGHVAAKHIDLGFPDDYLEKLQESLQPGSSALVVLVDQEWVEKVAETLATFDGQVLQHALTDDIVAQIS